MKFFWLSQIKKDFLWSYSYRLTFYGQFLALFVTIIPIFFLDKTFDGSNTPHLDMYNQNYFLFAIIGVSFASFIVGCLGSPAKAVRVSQTHGFVDILLNSKINAHYVIFCSMLYPFVIGLFKVLISIFLAFMIEDIQISFVTLMSITFVCTITFLCFVGLGFLSASFVLAFKQGDPINFILVIIITVFSGTIYPITVLPDLFQQFANLTPFAIGLDMLRKIVIFNSSRFLSLEAIYHLFIFASLLIFAGLTALSAAIKKIKMTGTSALY